MSDLPADSSEEETGATGDAPIGTSAHETNESAADAQSPPDADAAAPSDAATASGDAEASESYESSGAGMRARDVEVPMRVYKTVTVFSTLIAVVCVVGGFILLDRATNRAQLPLSEVDPVIALAGVGTILVGAATYAFGTRFRARGMGRSKNDADDKSDNG